MKVSAKPAMDVSLNIRLPEAELKRIDELVAKAKARGEKVNRSRIARDALTRALAVA